MMCSEPTTLTTRIAPTHHYVQTKVVRQCCLKTVDDEAFNIYPLAFLLYITFLFMLTALILTENHLHYDHTALRHIQFDTHSSQRWRAYSSDLDGLCWLIVYCVVIVVSGESYFHFYLCYVYSPSGC